MTVVGKIMVFFVVIFSLIQGGLAIMLYTARTQWVAAYTEQSKEIQVARANADQFAVEVKKARDEADAKIAQKNVQVKKLQDEGVALQKEIQDWQAKDQKQKLDAGTANAMTMQAQADLQRRQADNDQMRKTLNEQLAENKRLVDLSNTLRTEKITADIEVNALRERDKQLTAKLEEAARDDARRRSSVAAGSSGKIGTGKNPPQENIEGLVKRSQGNLVNITIGSDAGLLKGQTLEVFRLSSIPDQSKYLGTIRIIDVSTTEAVGEPVGRMAGPMQAGDRVASRILGS